MISSDTKAGKRQSHLTWRCSSQSQVLECGVWAGHSSSAPRLPFQLRLHVPRVHLTFELRRHHFREALCKDFRLTCFSVVVAVPEALSPLELFSHVKVQQVVVGLERALNAPVLSVSLLLRLSLSPEIEVFWEILFNHLPVLFFQYLP